MKMLLTLSIFISFFVKADDINNYRYYQMNHSEKYIAYIKKNDPCIYGGRIKENDIHKYCEMADSRINLKLSYPTVYVSRASLFGSYLDIIVAAPWNEQNCRIDLLDNNIFCEPTGK